MSRGRREKKKRKSIARSASPEVRASPRDSAGIVAPGSPAGRYAGWQIVAAVLALTVACLAVFASVRNNDFVYYDDPKYVTENPVVSAGLTARGFAWALTTGTDANWFPLTWLSHMLDVQLYGIHAGGHHLTSLILHIISTLLLFGVFFWMTGALGRSVFVAGLFAIHPLHVESVAWVAERKDVLSTLFWMLILWAYAWYTRRPQTSRYILVLALFAAGLMSKPMLVTVPFVLLLLDYWPLERRSKSFAQLVREKVPLFALAIISSVVTFLVQRKGGAVGGVEAYPVVLRIGNALVSYLGYIGKMLWPQRLAAFYPYPDTISGSRTLGAVAILIVVSVLVARAARTYPYLLFGWLWYLVTLLPVIGLIQVGNQAMADRYTYVPLIGVFVIIAWGANDLLTRWRASRIALPVAATIVLIACAMVSRAQVRHWRDSKSLWTHALRVTNDNYVAHNNLGLALLNEGKIDDAIVQYNEALRIRPGYATARTNLGAALSKQGKTSDAISSLYEALRQKPDLAEAHVNLGAALSSQGKIDEAIVEYNEALRLKPGNADAHANLGLALIRQGKVDEAIAQYTEALRIRPNFADVHNNLAYALGSVGRLDEAIVHYKEAIRLKPDFELAWINLGMTLSNQDKFDSALTAFREALRINPSNEQTRASINMIAGRRRR